MQNDLLWVYEGLTDYYGNVLTARSGMRTPEQARDEIALTAASFEVSPGRTWRSLDDTTNQPIISSHGASPETWPSWQRSYDYYPESDLIWLDADTKIRELSGGTKSLDDFAKLFFGIDNGSYITRDLHVRRPGRSLELGAALRLGKVPAYPSLRSNPQVPEGGITQGGYGLVYNDNQPDWMKHGDPVPAHQLRHLPGIFGKWRGKSCGRGVG